MEFRLIPKDLKMKILKIFLRKLGHPSGRIDNVFLGKNRKKSNKKPVCCERNQKCLNLNFMCPELTEW